MLSSIISEQAKANGPVLTISQIIKFVMASAAKAELAAIYNMAREIIPLCKALEDARYLIDR